jgi:hypothetical protein
MVIMVLAAMGWKGRGEGARGEEAYSLIASLDGSRLWMTSQEAHIFLVVHSGRLSNEWMK